MFLPRLSASTTTEPPPVRVVAAPVRELRVRMIVRVLLVWLGSTAGTTTLKASLKAPTASRAQTRTPLVPAASMVTTVLRTKPIPLTRLPLARLLPQGHNRGQSPLKVQTLDIRDHVHRHARQVRRSLPFLRQLWRRNNLHLGPSNQDSTWTRGRRSPSWRPRQPAPVRRLSPWQGRRRPVPPVSPASPGSVGPPQGATAPDASSGCPRWVSLCMDRSRVTVTADAALHPPSRTDIGPHRAAARRIASSRFPRACVASVVRSLRPWAWKSASASQPPRSSSSYQWQASRCSRTNSSCSPLRAKTSRFSRASSA